MRVLVLGVAFTDVKGFPFGRYDPVGTNKGSVKLTHGGVARNVAEDLARLGCDVVFPLPVDRTPLGHDIKARLEEAGVDMSEAISVPDGGTGMWLAVFNEKGDLAGSVSKMPDVAPIENKLDSDGDRLFGACDAVVAEFDTSEAIAEKTGRSLTREQAEKALRQAVADTCYQVLCDAGVYKQDEAGQAGLKRFLDTVF